MAKKLGKFLAATAIIGAAAGAFMYYKSREEALDDFDDFDDFEDEGEAELEAYLQSEAEQSDKAEQALKDILPSSALNQETVDEAKEALKKAVMDTSDKVESVSGLVKNDMDMEVEEFHFDDLKAEDGDFEE